MPVVFDEFEGVIVCTDGGEPLDNQAGGVACLHPSTIGVFIPWTVPQALQRMICEAELWDDSIPHELLARMQVLVPWPIIAEGSYEAWLRVRLSEKIEGVIVWENCD